MRFFSLSAAIVLLASFLLAAPVQAEPDAATPTAQTASYSGNIKSKIFHKTGCRYFTCKSCKARFASAEEARSAGYQPCKLCIGK